MEATDTTTSHAHANGKACNSKHEKTSAKACRKMRKAEKKAWKRARPKKEPWLAPILIVSDIRASAELYERAFGFKIEAIIDGPDGKAIHASLRHRRGSIMLGTGMHSKLASPAKLHGATASIYVYVADVDALVERARAAGMTVEIPPTDQFWGDRCANLVDAEGHAWMFATHLRRPTVEVHIEAGEGPAECDDEIEDPMDGALLAGKHEAH